MFYFLNFVIPIALAGLFNFFYYRKRGPITGVIGVITVLFILSLPFLNTSGWYEVPFEVVP